MLKNDRWITEQAQAGMLEPFQAGLVRHLKPDQKQRPVLSFGCSSYGYDLRLSPQEFLIFKHVPGTVMNPKRFNPANLEPTELHHDGPCLLTISGRVSRPWIFLWCPPCSVSA